MESSLDIQQDTLFKIEQILSKYFKNDKLIFGKTQLVYVSLICPFRDDTNAYLQDLDQTLQMLRKIIYDPYKIQDLNYFLFNLYDRYIIKNQNKQIIFQDLLKSNQLAPGQLLQEFNEAQQSVQIIIDSYLTSFHTKSLSLLIVFSSLLSKYLLKTSFTEKLFAYSTQLNQIQIPTLVNPPKKIEQEIKIDARALQNQNLKNGNQLFNNQIYPEKKIVGLSQNQRNVFQIQNELNKLEKKIQGQEREFQKPYEVKNIKSNPQNYDLNDINKYQINSQQQLTPSSQQNNQNNISNQRQQNKQFSNQNNISKPNNDNFKEIYLKKVTSERVSQKNQNEQVLLKRQISEKVETNENYLKYFPLNQNNQDKNIPNNLSQIPINNLLQNKQNSIQNQPLFYSEEIDNILKQITELTQEERGFFMKIFGKYEAGMNGQLLDDLKKRYPEIYYLIKASQALNKVRKILPRSVQIISCLLFLYRQKQKGRILQINTGEGKSITVALMAATRSLMKDKVDIFTSNKELAKRDCEEFQGFYKDLGLTCGSIGTEEFRSSEPNETYKKDIVYGEVGSYAADLLGDQYELRGTRCGRKFDFAIVDEVDCMFIDQHNHSTSLAKCIPGLSKLNTILWLIWYKITQMRDQYLEGYYYFVDSENKYCCRAEDFITEFLNLVLMNNEVSAEIDTQIPQHMKQFAIFQMKEWINNGFYALQLQRNKEYKVDNDKIIPIDYDNTGVAQLNTQWRGGLHQFIQMKENVTVTPMTLTVNFVSNIYMFLLYKNNIVGLTGTLGSEKSIDVLQQFYQVDTMKIPLFKSRKLQILPPIVEKTTSDFQNNIFTQIQQLMSQGRPCLIISESEKSSKHIYKLISKKFQGIKLVEYYSGNESIEKDLISDFCVFLSTNLAGRGTDIKISPQVIKNGGLHVIVTFTPKNKRVEDQAFGRAGRCGQDGSAQMIIDGSKDSFILKNRIQQNLIEERDKVDAYFCERQHQNMKDISKMDEIFWDYCKTLNNCEILKDKEYLRKQEEEIWATFYCKIQSMRREPEKAVKEYKVFKEEFQKRISERNIVNASYLINQGMKLLIKNKYTEALSISDQIIQKNVNNFAAYYIKAIALYSLKNPPQSLLILDRCEEILKQKNNLHQALQILQLQSQSLVQQEYNQELYDQSMLICKQFQNQAHESQIFSLNKYDRKVLEAYITESGCFKRIKDEEFIRGKILQQIKDLKGEIKASQKMTFKNSTFNYFRLDEFFQDDKITPQILKEYQNEELPFIVNLSEKQPMQWKSLIPVACGIFQLSNSLYLLQAQMISIGVKKNPELEIGKSNAQNTNYIQSIEEHDQQIQGIAQAVERMIAIEGLNLKEYLSKKSITLIHQIKRFQIEDYAHMLNEISESSANTIQKELMIQISFKDALTREVAKYSQQMALITQQMSKDQKFLGINKLLIKFQENCNKIIEQTQQFKLLSKNQIEIIYKAFKKQFQYLNFQLFQRDVIKNLRHNLYKNYKNLIVENLESFVQNNYELLLSSNQFYELVSNLIQEPLENSVKLTIDNLQVIVQDTVRDHLIHRIKQEIQQLNQQLNNNNQNVQKLQKNNQNNNKNGNNYSTIQNKIKNYQNIQVVLEQEEELIQQFINSLKQAIIHFQIETNNDLSRLPEYLDKVQIKNFILNQNQKLAQYEDFFLLIQKTLILLQEKNLIQFNPSDFQSQITKKISNEILVPTFKIVSHVFLQQIESNAIYGLFNHIINQ